MITFKKINLKNRSHYFFNDMVNIKNFYKYLNFALAKNNKKSIRNIQKTFKRD